KRGGGGGGAVFGNLPLFPRGRPPPVLYPGPGATKLGGQEDRHGRPRDRGRTRAPGEAAPIRLADRGRAPRPVRARREGLPDSGRGQGGAGDRPRRPRGVAAAPGRGRRARGAVPARGRLRDRLPAPRSGSWRAPRRPRARIGIWPRPSRPRGRPARSSSTTASPRNIPTPRPWTTPPPPIAGSSIR